MALTVEWGLPGAPVVLLTDNSAAIISGFKASFGDHDGIKLRKCYAHISRSMTSATLA